MKSKNVGMATNIPLGVMYPVIMKGIIWNDEMKYDVQLVNFKSNLNTARKAKYIKEVILKYKIIDKI